MARRDALLRLTRTLLAHSGDLRKRLVNDLADLHEFKAIDSTGDRADQAFETSSDEMSCELAKLEARELSQIERALACLQQGKYGICQGRSKSCRKKIPVSRLNALPYTTLCINCERQMKNSPDRQGRPGARNWNQGFDSEEPPREQPPVLSELEKWAATRARWIRMPSARPFVNREQ